MKKPMTLLTVVLFLTLLGGLFLVFRATLGESVPGEARGAAERLKKVGRNEPCFCGSGRKYKTCHRDADRDLKGRLDAQADHDAVAAGNEPLIDREVARRGFSKWPGIFRRGRSGGGSS